MDKKSFLNQMHRQRAAWDTMLARLSPGQMDTPGVNGRWSVKDIIAHIAWYEQEMVTLLTTRTLAGSPWWNLPPAARNARIYDQNRERPLPDVLAESQSVYQALLDAVNALDENALHDAGAFANMPSDWTPWQIVADSSYDHYEAHLPDLRALIESKTD